LLSRNLSAYDSSKAVNFDTRLPSNTTPDKISDSARVDKFLKVSYFVFPNANKNKNVLVKYKGNGFIEPRCGDAMQRVGIMGRLSGKKFKDGHQIDYSTNIESVQLSFMYSTN